MINDRNLRFQLVQRKFFFPPPLPIKSRPLICDGSNKYRRLLSLFRERFIHAERHVNWHVQGAKQHVASPTHQLPRLIYRAGFISVAGPLIPLLRWRFTRSTRLAPGVYFDPPVRIPATSIRPMELSPGRELSPLFRCLIAASDCLICSTMWIRSITGRSTRFTLCRESDTRYRSDIALSLELIVPSLKYLFKLNIHHLHIDRIQK